MNDAERDFLDRAIELAEASGVDGNPPVGAVIALEGEVIAEGRAQTLEPDYDPGRHAEMQAIERVDTELWERAGEMTCYSTLEPCVMCAGTLLLHGVGRVVFGASDPEGGAEPMLEHLPPYYDCREIYEWEGPILPDECDPLYRRVEELYGELD
ncbi:MAG: nucleoside deaminase [Bradymonadaceae bacterium]